MMDDKFFADLEKGVKEAVFFARGDVVEGVKVHQIQVQDIDPQVVRAVTGLSEE